MLISFVIIFGCAAIASSSKKRAAMAAEASVGWISRCVAEELRSGSLVALKTPHFSLGRPLYSLRLRVVQLRPWDCVPNFPLFCLQALFFLAPRANLQQ